MGPTIGVALMLVPTRPLVHMPNRWSASTPGVPVYTLGSPVFDDVSIKLDNGKTFRLSATNNSRENKYIQLVKLNGKALDRLWFHHTELRTGGHLEVEKGNTRNRNLGIFNPPPSSLTLDPASLN